MITDQDKYYHPHLLAQIKGAMFQFKHGNKSPVYGARVCIKNERAQIDAFDANQTDPFLVVLHPTFGQPGKLAYSLLKGLEYHLYKTRNPVFEGTATDLLKLSEVADTTKRRIALKIALNQLSETRIYYHAAPFLQTRKNYEGRFSLVTFEKYPGRRGSFRIELDPLITDALYVRKKFHIYNHTRISHLDARVECFAYCVLDALTRWKIKYEKRDEPLPAAYNKKYEKVCRDWLGGVKPQTTQGRAWSNHLKERIEPLVACGILHEDSHVSPSMNLMLIPGELFLSDHEELHPKKKVLTQADKDRNKEIRRVIDLFDSILKYDRIRRNVDNKQSEALIEQYGPKGALAFVKFGAAQANNTGYRVQFLNGLEGYKDAFERFMPAELKKKEAPPSDIEVAAHQQYVDKFYDDLEKGLSPREQIDVNNEYAIRCGSIDNPDAEFKQFSWRESMSKALGKTPRPLDMFVRDIREKKKKQLETPEESKA